MEHDFLSHSERKISGSNETSKEIVLFFPTELSKLKFEFHFFKAINLGLRNHFWVNGADLSNGKCDSGTKFTRPTFCLPFAQPVNRPACPCKWCKQPSKTPSNPGASIRIEDMEVGFKTTMRFRSVPSLSNHSMVYSKNPQLRTWFLRAC